MRQAGTGQVVHYIGSRGPGRRDTACALTIMNERTAYSCDDALVTCADCRGWLDRVSQERKADEQAATTALLLQLEAVERDREAVREAPRRTLAVSQRQAATTALLLQLRALQVFFVQEHRFHPERKWRFDVALPDYMVAIEVDGGTFLPTGGRHTRGAGHREDLRKTGAALELGWLVVHTIPELVKSGEALRHVEAAIRIMSTRRP
jgi:hypothetical protein